MNIDPTPYLGSWILCAIGPRTEIGSASIEVVRGATNTLQVHGSDEYSKGTYEVLLTKIGEDVYGCARIPDVEFVMWSLFRPVLTKDQKQLEIRGFDQKAIKTAISKGHLEGKTITTLGGAESVRITDKGSNMRQFLEVYSDIVQVTPTITFRRPQ